MIRRFMWADDARGGVRQLLLHSAANGQVEQLRVLAFCALTSLAGDVENSGPMWRDEATRAATVRTAASPGPGPGSRPSPHSNRNQVSAAANSQPEPVRVQALRTLASLACDGANKKSMWVPSSEGGAREVCCCVTTCTQPPTLHASQLQPQVLVPSSPLHNLHVYMHMHMHCCACVQVLLVAANEQEIHGVVVQQAKRVLAFLGISEEEQRRAVDALLSSVVALFVRVRVS